MIKCGYYNIFRPPYATYQRSTMYCIQSLVDDILIILPLSISVFSDMCNLIKVCKMKKVYVIVPDVGISFISDFYNLHYYIHTHLQDITLKFISKYLPDYPDATTSFISSFERSESDKFVIPITYTEMDINLPTSSPQQTVGVEFTEIYKPGYSPYACDVIVTDTNRKLFASNMTDDKVRLINDNHNILWEELHMGYMRSNYSMYGYHDAIKVTSAIMDYTYCNLFTNTSEYDYAKSRHVKVGEVFKYDSI